MEDLWCSLIYKDIYKDIYEDIYEECTQNYMLNYMSRQEDFFKSLRQFNTAITKDDLERVKPYIVTYKSKPIKGVVLELVTINPNYKEENW